MAPSLVWRLFNKNGTFALCVLCGKRLSSSNTSNCWSHLENRHEKEFIELDELQKSLKRQQNLPKEQNEEAISDSSNKNSQSISISPASPEEQNEVATSSSSNQSSNVPTLSQTSTSTVSNSSARQLRQTTLGNKFNKLSRADVDKITNAIAYFIAVDGEPYSVVEHKGFQNLMNVLTPMYTIPSRTTFSERKVPKLHKDTKKIIIEKVKNIQYISLTTDGWTAPNTHKFIALTGSYIDDEWILQTNTLSCHDLNISNTGDNIKKLILNELSDYKIDRKKIAGITTDRGPNVISAVELMGFNWIPCFGHVINTKMEEMLQHKFIAPTLQKIKSIFAALSFSSNLKIHLTSCQAELNLPQNKMPSTCPTRWWSEIDQFKFVVRFEMALYKMVTTYPDMDQTFLINSNDINRIKAILLVMEPMEKYVTTLGSEKIVTASFIPPLILKLHIIFDKFKYSDPVESFEIRKFFRTIPKFCHDLYIEEKSHVELAAYLDPRFKGNRRPDLDAILLIEIKDIIAMKALNETDSAQSEVSPKNATAKEKRKTVLEELFEDGDESDPVNDPQSEIDLFHSQVKIKITECPLKWWKTRCSIFPHLNIVAKKYLCLSATSVLSERVFSDGKYIMPDNRFRLTDEHTGQLIFLSMNNDIVPQK